MVNDKLARSSDEQQVRADQSGAARHNETSRVSAEALAEMAREAERNREVQDRHNRERRRPGGYF